MNSLGLTKQLIRDLERMQGGEGKSQNMGANRTVDMPGITGVYDGDNMVTEKGEKFAVPQNYASKSELVFGDTLKRIEEKSGAFLFKQIQRVKRYRQDGVLVKKEGKWAVVTDGGSYKTLNASVEHFKLKEGDEVFAILPEGNKNCPFAAISPKTQTLAQKPEVIKPEIPKKEEPVKPKEEKKVEKKVEVKEVRKIKPSAPAAKVKKEEMSLSEEGKKPSSRALTDEDLR